VASWTMTGRAARCAAFAAWALCVQAPLLGSEPTPADAESLAAPNQSVALSPSAGDATVLDAGGANMPRTADAADTPNESTLLPPRGTGPRILRRRDSGASEASTVIPEATPWYHSGVGALAIVLGLVAVVFYVLRRFVPSMRAPDHGAIRVVARTALTPKHSVALIRLGRRFVLVGVSGDRLNTLAEVNDADEVGALAALVGGAASPDDFSHALADESMSYEVSWDGVPEPNHDRATDTNSRRTSRGASALAQLKSRLLSLQSK